MPVGVLAIQGDYVEHIEMLRRCDPSLDIREIRTPEELAEVDRVIVPGGESTTVGLLMERYGLGNALKQRAKQGMPIWGTCMGMIVMAHEIVGKEQYTLDLLDITVERNAFGAQVNSFEDEVSIEGLKEPVTGVFIRAPIVTRVGKGVQELAKYHGKVVAVRHGNLIGTSFHPELTEDDRVHRWFLSL
ncbi:MAG TPA: pyridoxal 5'-phosphate synthase glutaminase subunit PdxT [Fimbriimonadaceae bacterium]|jgi:5'-phosphate synthase pdxT subunit